MLVVGKDVGLHGQIGATGIGNIHAIEPAALGDGLGPHVFFQGDGEIGPRLDPAVIGDDHGPVAVYLAQSCDNTAAGYILHIRVVHAETGDAAQLEEIGAGVDQFFDELTNVLFSLLGQALNRLFASRPGGLVDELVQFELLVLPKCSVLHS